MMQAAMDIALLTGLRRGDILKLTRDSITDAGLRVETSKTDKPLLFAMTDELKAARDRALAIQPKVRRFVICNKQGKAYSGHGFSTLRKRARRKALKDKSLATPFAFNDIRAKSASDDDNADRASQRLGHTNRQTTERYYIRTPRKVTPLR
jgi:integrase